MVLDVILAGILLTSVFLAARTGITRELVRIASLVVGLVVAMWGYGMLAQELRPWIADERVAVMVAFVAIYIACLIAGAALALTLSGVWELTGLRWIDMALGGAFGLVRGLLLSVALVLMLIAFRPFPAATKAFAGSRIAPMIVNMARTAALLAPKGLREAFGIGADHVHEIRAEGEV